MVHKIMTCHQAVERQTILTRTTAGIAQVKKRARGIK